MEIKFVKVGHGPTAEVLPTIVETSEKHPAVLRFEAMVDRAEKVEVPRSKHFPFKVSRLLALPPVLRHVMAIAMWDSQIRNGGIDQWMENGYACTLPYLLAACDVVGTPNAKRVAAIAIGVTEGSNDDDAGSENIRHLDEQDEDSEGRYDSLDTEYYSFDDDFLREAGERLIPPLGP